MLVLQALNLQKSFGRQEVLRGVSLAVNEKERVGLVGVNGSGKTTLLKCLSGEVWPDSGEVHRSSSLSLACLEQISEFPHGITAWEAVMDSFSDLINMRHSMRSLEAQMASGDGLDRVLEKYARINEAYERANGYACENMTRRILSGLGFSPQEYDQPLDTFSGGQKSRLKLGRLLATAPDILLLDEPTNHLDMPSVEWLEDYIRNYAGTVVLVSHDRMFLDTVATRIVELRGGHLRSFPGNYSHYLQARAEQDLAWQKAYEKQQEYIRATEAYIRRFKAGIKSRQARGRQSQLDRLQRIPAVDHRQSLSRTRIAVKHSSAHDVLSLEGICKSFAEREVLKNVDLRIEKGDRLALIGPNGCGKSTLLKIICGQLTPEQGELRLGSRVLPGYFSQENEDLNPDNSVLDEIMTSVTLTLEEARTALGTMLFSGDDVFKRVRDLSGGDKGRLAFLKLILSGANFLLLDEPTNHMDIESRQAVEDMLAHYAGTVLLVSHDRHFIDKVAERVIAIEDGQLHYYWGNYSYYHEKIQEKHKAVREQKKIHRQKQLEPEMLAREAQKEQGRLRRRLIRELEELEGDIEQMEARKVCLEELLADPVTYSQEEKARTYVAEYKELELSLLAAYEDWESRQAEVEKLEADAPLQNK